MAHSVLSENVPSHSHGLTKPGFESQVNPVIVSEEDEDEDNDMPHLVRMSPTKMENVYHEDFHTPDTIESLEYGDPVVIVGMGRCFSVLLLFRRLSSTLAN